MATINLSIGFDVRDTSKELQNFSVLANVSRGLWENKIGSIMERSEKLTINAPEWSYQNNTGLATDFKRHNGFKDQERINRMSMNFIKRQGTFVKYYVTSYDPMQDPIYKEDNNREVERYFDLPLMLTFQPEMELYARFGVQHMDEFETHVHMSLFLELNYASLVKHGVKPACDPNSHNPIWSQRGYEAFSYYGYSFQQIGPRAGDYVKVEAFNTLYMVENVKNAAPEFEPRWRKYWWKLFLKDAMDGGQKVSAEVLNDPEQEGFINTLLGAQSGSGILDQQGNPITYPFDVSTVINTVKKDVLFRPPQMPQSVDDIDGDSTFYACPELFGKW